MNLEALIRKVAQQLDGTNLCFGHGTDNALDEAHWLVLHTCGIPVDQPVGDYTTIIPHEQVIAVESVLQRRITERIPLAYLLHSAWFAGLEFYVDERVLVPRSPIAELIYDGFSDWFEG